MDDELSELKTVEKRFDNILTEVNKLVDMIEEVDLEPFIDEYLSKVLKEEKIPKRQKEKMALEYLNKKCPKFVADMKGIELLLKGVELSFEDKREQLENIQDKISEIEELKEEVQREVDNI